MDTINPHACREGFEQQRKAGINVDWFTWQIAWHDAMFTQVDCAPPPASTNRLTDDLLVQLFYAAQGDITKFRIKARALLEAK